MRKRMLKRGYVAIETIAVSAVLLVLGLAAFVGIRTSTAGLTELAQKQVEAQDVILAE